MPALYEKTRERIASDINKAKYFAATTDMWSSSTMEPYLSYSIYFIDNNWIQQTKCLQTLFVCKHHTADNFCEAMTETLKLEMDQQACITIDNGSNITCAATSRLM